MNKQAFLAKLEENRALSVLMSYGYWTLSDVHLSAQEDPDDPEPQKILDWYKAYDDVLWNTFEEDPNADPVEIEKSAFDATKSILPQSS